MSPLPVKRLAAAALAVLVAWCAAAPLATCSDWPRFRGENGSGISPDSAATPTEWSDSKNLTWSVDLPGPGVSCPIVVGNRVIVTCWTGSGPDDLMRRLMCFDRRTGKQIWSKEVAPAAKDESHDGMFTQTGYTAHTPASDGKHIFAFFGVSGVYAFDMDGEQVWHKTVGTEFGMNHWGTASSPVLCKDLVIVPATAESKSLIALRKDTGEEAWRYEAPQFTGTWSTPILVDLPDGKQEIVITVPGAVWGFDAENGSQPKWTCQAADGNSACASAVAHGDMVYAIGGRNGGGLAIRAGGEGDVTATHVVWSKNHNARIGSPIFHDGLIYWYSDGLANCADAETGESIYKKRLAAPKTAQADSEVTQAAAQEPAPQQPAGGQDAGGQQAQAGNQPGGQGPGRGGRGDGRGGGGRGRFGGGGGFMQQDYSSPVLADGKIYFARRGGDVYVFALGREFKQLAVNKFSGEADYSASPAIADGQIFIRSSKKLYCVANTEQL